MRRVIESIIHAVPGVLNAFLINFILICIYAVLSVDFFSEIYTDCDEEGFEGPAAMLTARGKCWGFDYYGTFSRSLYTMFQVLTGESWSEAGARPALTYYMDREEIDRVVLTYLFFYSFVIINSFVLLNVVVAVLMDGMNNAAPASQDSGTGDKEEAGPKNDSDNQPYPSKESGSDLTNVLAKLADIQTQLNTLIQDVAELKHPSALDQSELPPSDVRLRL
jgi:hypothetical protein